MTRLAVFLSVVMLSACGNAALNASQVESTSALQLYTGYVSLTGAARSEWANRMAATPVMSYYEALLRTTTDVTLTLGGRTVYHPRTQLSRARASYQALAAQYQTLGAYWQASHFNPELTLTKNQFMAVVSSEPTIPSLSLTEQGTLPVGWDPLQVPAVGCNVGALPPGATAYDVDDPGLSASVREAREWLNRFNTVMSVSQVGSSQGHGGDELVVAGDYVFARNINKANTTGCMVFGKPGTAGVTYDGDGTVIRAGANDEPMDDCTFKEISAPTRNYCTIM